MPTIAEKRRAFRQLHESGCFVIPNPWDAGTARYLQHLGFKALATTSSGAAFSMALPDTDWALTRDPMLAHIRSIVEASDVPVKRRSRVGVCGRSGGTRRERAVVRRDRRGGAVDRGFNWEASRPLYSFDLAVAQRLPLPTRRVGRHRVVSTCPYER
jgi:hypothetical protein